jgi:hypoxanthine phosphoribosyltransferase
MKKILPRRARKRSFRLLPGVLPDGSLRLVYTAPQIQKRVRELAAQINRDYRGETLHLVGILENCFLFMADLVRHLEMPVICHFIKADIRDASAGAVAVREIMYTPKVNAAGRHLLLVDGILQSGVTLDHLIRYILGQNPRSVRAAALIEKVDEKKVDVKTEYLGFRTTAKYLVGYGLGYQDRYRNLPYIAQIVRGHRRRGEKSHVRI